ncbi:MAG: GntR family transcriptional regulator, partial [Lentisphaeria bacterium]
MRKTGGKKRVTIKAEQPLYAQVQEKLRGHIARMKVGDRLSSERQLSEYFKVDRITIRRAMMDLENEGYVVRHQGRGTFIRQLAAQDRRQVTGTKAAGAKVIGLIVPDLELPMQAHLLKGVEEAAAGLGVKVWIRNALLDPNREYELLESLGRESLAGIITAPLSGNVFAKPYVERINQLAAAGR